MIIIPAPREASSSTHAVAEDKNYENLLTAEEVRSISSEATYYQNPCSIHNAYNKKVFTHAAISAPTETKMLTPFTVLLLSACVASVIAIQCVPDDCKAQTCDKDLKCKDNQVLDPQGSFCGCCPACIDILKEGADCGMTLMRGGPPTERCQDGLTCSQETQKCEK